MAKLDLRSAQASGLDLIADYMKALSTHWRPDALYRGHADRNWTLRASIFRDEAVGIASADHLKAWRRMAQRLVAPQPDSDLGYLVLAQHYGVATALLDWTSHPLIALFFACQHVENRSGDGMVMQIDRDAFQTIERMNSVAIFKGERSRPLLLDTSEMNIRSTAQDSYMTLHTADEPLLEASNAFAIKAEDKFRIRAALRMFGMTPERIFVDLATAAKQFTEELELQDLFGDEDL